MKQTALLACFLMLSSLNAQKEQTWSLGAQFGAHGNTSTFSGGMEEANAHFQHTKFGGGSLQLLARYDYNKHWMLMSGIGFYTFGFEYSISHNYSLLTEMNRFTGVHSEFTTAEIPLMIHYKFNPTCMNNYLIVGAGIVHSIIGKQSSTQTMFEGTEGNTNGNYITSVSSTTSRHNEILRLSIGIERKFKHGNMLNLSMVLNHGLVSIATSHVTYRIDGKEYEHQFSNSGNFAGFRIAYFFRPFGSRRN
jgi:hypothetical protein